MPSRRAEIALTDDEVEAFLRARHTAVLCTVGPDGLPDPVGMWYVVGAGGALEMTTYRRSQKVVNLRRDPRAVVLVEDGATYDELRGVQLTCRAEVVEDTGRVLDTIVAVARRYSGLTDEHVPAAREAARGQAAKRVLLRLLPRRTVSWDHRKL